MQIMARAGAAAELVASQTPSDRYRMQCAEDLDAIEAVAAAARTQPKLLCIDADLCATIGEHALSRMSRLLPGTRWVFGWSRPSDAYLPLLMATRARGCICWTDSAVQSKRAIDAVMEGQLWFPRAVAQSLVEAMYAGREVPVRPQVHLGPTQASLLTERETQVMGLMRLGLTNGEIALSLGISVNTVKTHLTHVFVKRGLRRRGQQSE